ncbi:MAG: glycosyltransferase family 4 protein [Phycisphaerales bacterium]|nr:MAG: glycosyltransferase family 4 protein [Phycisphaerales bacterium]
MRIGIVPSLKPHDGGVYQYSLTMLHALAEGRDKRDSDEIVVFAHDAGHPAVAELERREGCSVKPFRPPWKAERSAVLQTPRNLDEVLPQRDMRQWYHECGIELMVYPNPHRLSFETGIPYVMAIHDLQHRLQPQFPEVSANGEWDRREYLFRNGARHATILLADSEVGTQDILDCYGCVGVTADRVRMLPFLPAVTEARTSSQAERRTIQDRYGLPERYLFYPAQFWPHKNHILVVEALGRLKKHQDLRIAVVFTGSHDGTLREQAFARMMATARLYEIEERVHFLGHIPDEEIAALFTGATALVMPTFFGPTNIPVLEAWSCGCPVLTSGIRGIREQVGDGGVLVDPNSTAAIADGIHRLWTDEALRASLIERGRRRLALYTRADYGQQLEAIMEAARQRVVAARAALATS